MATTYGLELQQADVDSAFLYGGMDTELYMKQPSGFIEPGRDHLVCKLKKCQYGTKQSPCQWYLKIQSRMIKNGYKSCSTDNSIFYQSSNWKNQYYWNSCWRFDNSQQLIWRTLSQLLYSWKNHSVLKNLEICNIAWMWRLIVTVRMTRWFWVRSICGVVGWEIRPDWLQALLHTV